MNTRYSVTSNGYWWDVRNPRGQRVEGLSREQWATAVHLAHKFSTADQLRDQKYRELFTPFEQLGHAYAQAQNVYTKAFQDFARGFQKAQTATDHALAN